ncbi:hypothetical protein IFM89_007240 [Coptis chinensis]|uniref:Ubiquitin-like domain-containing protein n=1 Tax=Coptis chinensis TaxID=261450 RepID=A0A835M7P9_9MAGN|nr:hypothetical protein IFM89_007240 [Coptis chinensis]
MVNLKSVSFAEDWLQNEQKVVDYDIKNGSIISVFLDSGFRTKIHVKMLQTGKPITLDVGMRDTVLTIKRKIQNKEAWWGSQLAKRKLGLDKVELENDMTLADLHFSEGQTLNLRSDNMQIFIRVPSGKLINCRVDGSYTVQNVQEMIEEQEGIHIRSQRLIYGAMQLEPSRSLDDYNIKEDATIHLVLRLCGC